MVSVRLFFSMCLGGGGGAGVQSGPVVHGPTQCPPEDHNVGTVVHFKRRGKLELWKEMTGRGKPVNDRQNDGVALGSGYG